MPKKINRTRMPKIDRLPSGSYHTLVYSHKTADGKRKYESLTDPDYNNLVLRVAAYKKERAANRADPITNTTVGEAINAYINARDGVLSPVTLREYRRSREKDLQEIMTIPLARLTQEDVQKAISAAAKTHSPKTVRNQHGLLAAVIKDYRPDFTLNTRLPKKIKPSIAIPSEEDISALLEAADDPRMSCAIVLAACAGLRRGEIAALKWGNVEKDVLNIVESQYIEKGKRVDKKTKTEAGAREVPIVAEIRSYLDALPQSGEYVIGYPYNGIYKRFLTIQKRAGVGPYRFHALRHYLVSAMISQGVPVSYIVDYVGHESSAMVERVYSHIMKRKKDDVVDIMQKYFTGTIFNNAIHNAKQTPEYADK